MDNATKNYVGLQCKLPEAVSVFGLIWASVVISAVGMFNNLLIILLVWRNKAMHNPTNFLLANNAFTEFIYLVVSTVMVSIVIYIENTSEAFTSSEIKEIYSFFVAIRVFIVSPFFITAVNLALLAIERYNALIHPMKIHRRLTKRAVKIVICIIWILAMLFSAPFSVTVQVGSEKSWYFLLGTIVTSVAISLFIIVSCYGKIIYGIYISKTIFNDASSATNAQDVKDKKNIVKMLITNTLLFGVTRLPSLGYALRLLCLKDMSYGCLMYISLLGHVSAFCHPLMFILFSQNYRSAVKKMFTSCTNRGIRES